MSEALGRRVFSGDSKVPYSVFGGVSIVVRLGGENGSGLVRVDAGSGSATYLGLSFCLLRFRLI